jgi:homoserine dehydrogenase
MSVEFSDALKEAQALGYAEDPIFYIEGIDTAHKLIPRNSGLWDSLSYNSVYIEISKVSSHDIGCI